MPRFFISPESLSGDGSKITLTGDDAHHVSRSLRMRPGEKLTVCDGLGTDYFCRTSAFTGDTVTLDVEETTKSRAEPPVLITVYQALVKGDKFDTVVQKSVECGASAVCPFYSRNCIVRPTDDEEKRRQRRARIAREAAMQSGRGVIPSVRGCISFGEMIRNAAESDAALFCYEGDGTEQLPRLLEDIKRKWTGDHLDQQDRHIDGERQRRIAVIVGPEGGFAPDEAEAAKKSGLYMTALGPRILRTESAAEFALACIYYAFEV